MISPRKVKLLFPRAFGQLISYQNVYHGFLQKNVAEQSRWLVAGVGVPRLRHPYPTWWLMQVSFLKRNLFGFQHVILQNTDISYLGKRKDHLQKYLGKGDVSFPAKSLFWGLKICRKFPHAAYLQVASFCNIEEDLPTEDKSKRRAMKRWDVHIEVQRSHWANDFTTNPVNPVFSRKWVGGCKPKLTPNMAK